jgi:hypothetical protein
MTPGDRVQWRTGCSLLDEPVVLTGAVKAVSGVWLAVEADHMLVSPHLSPFVIAPINHFQPCE